MGHPIAGNRATHRGDAACVLVRACGCEMDTGARERIARYRTEVRERWADAAALLHDESGRSAAPSAYLTRAARDYLRAHADRPAEETLLAALLQDPDQGDLYRKLAIDVYAARGDFEKADIVLAAAQQNAVDLLPVYRGVSEVLARRDAAGVDDPRNWTAHGEASDATPPGGVDADAVEPVNASRTLSEDAPL